MPKQVLPSVEDFTFLKDNLLELGFREYTAEESERQFRRLGLKAPRVRPGKEVGFVLSANDLSVSVWTTWIASEERARDEDSAWVIISDGDDAVYFSTPTHRTKNFTINLLRRAWVAHWRVLNRPLCPGCNQFMRVARGRGMGARFWQCDRKSSHGDGRNVSLDWDHDLPAKARKFVNDARRKRARSRKARRAAGRPVGVAPLRRKSWRPARART